MKYREMTKEQKEKAFDLNVEELYNNHFKEERDEQNLELGEKILRFEEDWYISEESINWERANDGTIKFSMSESSLDEEAVLAIAESYPDKFDVSQIEEDIVWYEQVSSYWFEAWLDIYNNEMDLSFKGLWINTPLLDDETVKKRAEGLEKIELSVFESYKKERAFRKLFDAKENLEEIEEMMQIVEKEERFKFDWIKQMAELYKERSNKLMREITKSIDYLYSDRFIKDELEKSDCEFNEALKLKQQ